jgi:hypothetical protein
MFLLVWRRVSGVRELSGLENKTMVGLMRITWFCRQIAKHYVKKHQVVLCSSTAMAQELRA